MFVNPSPRKKRRKSSTRRRARAASRPKARKVRHRSRRRNAGITPFIQSNPMIIRNPKRRSSSRKRRRNPDFRIKPMLMNTVQMVGGAGVGAGVNLLALRRVTNPWLRNGLRVALAAACGAVFQNTFGGATGGALLYPTMTELAIMSNIMGEATATEADINELSADIEDLLDDDDSDDGDLFA